MKRLGLVTATLLLLGCPAVVPAVAATGVHVSGVVSAGGVPVAGATVTLGQVAVVSDGSGRYAADVPAGTTPLTLAVATPHVAHDTSATYHGTLDLTADRSLDLAVPGDRLTTMTLTEADGTTPVPHAEYDLFHGPGVKLVPAVGPFDYVTDMEHGADDAITDDAGRARFYSPDWVTSDRQSATLTAYDPHYTRPSVSTQVAYPPTPPTVALRFPASSAPSAPRNLTVSGVGQTAATFSWTSPASQGSAYVDSYRVTYGPTGAQSRVVDVPATAATGGQLQVGDLVPGRGYSVDVRAVSSAGVSQAVGTTFTTPRYAVVPRVESITPVQPVSGQSGTLAIDDSGGSTAYPVTGTVTVYDNGTSVGTATVSDGRATLTRTFLAGPHAIAVAYSGDATHDPAVPSSPSGVPPTYTVAKASSVTTATSSSSPALGLLRVVSLRVDVRAVAPGGGTPTGTVTVRDSVSGATRTLALSGGTATTTYTRLRTKQQVTFTLTYGGGPEHTASSVTCTVTP
jgi:hypothetical protein